MFTANEIQVLAGSVAEPRHRPFSVRHALAATSVIVSGGGGGGGGNESPRRSISWVCRGVFPAKISSSASAPLQISSKIDAGHMRSEYQIAGGMPSSCAAAHDLEEPRHPFFGVVVVAPGPPDAVARRTPEDITGLVIEVVIP